MGRTNLEAINKPVRTESVICASFLAIALNVALDEARSADPIPLRATYVENLSKFVEWPEQAFKDDPEHFNICIQGEEIFNTLASELRGHRVGKRAIVVTPLSRHPHGRSCQVLLISGDESWRVEAILSGISEHYILTISNSEGFAKSGGMIELVKVEERLGFEINQGIAEKAGVKISSQVLRLAKAVYR